MEALRQVHEYAVDRSTQTAKLGAVNPRRDYVSAEHGTVTVQLIEGETYFFDQGGQPMESEDIPAYILESVAKSPLRRGTESVEQVLKFCQFCPDDSNAIGSALYEGHLIEHLKRQGLQPNVASSSDGISKPAEVIERKATVAKQAAAVRRGKKG